MKSMSQQVALITGGTTGIGRATAIAFGRAGAKVVVTGRREAEGRETERLVQELGVEALFVRADASDEADMRRVVDATLTRFGRLDAAFNNAGVEGATIAPIADQSVDDFERVMAINVRGVFLSMKHEIPAMLRSGGGSIVNTSSIAGQVGFAGAAPYAASKFAVIGLTKTAALEYAKQKIRINAVAPGAIDTPMIDRFTQSIPRATLESLHPIGRTGKPEEIAAAVVWLCSNESSFVTGQTLTLDGGYTAQ